MKAEPSLTRKKCRPHTIRKVMKMESCHTAAPYLFQISSYDISRLLPQVSKALETRSEHLSRERYPKMWRSIDRLPSPSRGAKRSRLRTRLFSILCLAAGIVLVVPGLMEPKELLVPLVAGAAAVVLGPLGYCAPERIGKNLLTARPGCCWKGKIKPRKIPLRLFLSRTRA